MGEKGGGCGSPGRTVRALSKVIADVGEVMSRSYLHDQEVVQKSRARSGRGQIEVLQEKGRRVL